eukprot:Em0001g1886a
MIKYMQREVKPKNKEECINGIKAFWRQVTPQQQLLDDQGGPMIITELLDTTLRKAYEDNLLSPNLDQCMDIFRDVSQLG